MSSHRGRATHTQQALFFVWALSLHTLAPGFLNSFTEESLTSDNLHTRKLYTLISFDIYMHPWN